MKKIKVIHQEVDENKEKMTDEEYKENLFELLKSMDWKMWEILQILQRQEREIVEKDTDSDLKDIFDT